MAEKESPAKKLIEKCVKPFLYSVLVLAFPTWIDEFLIRILSNERLFPSAIVIAPPLAAIFLIPNMIVSVLEINAPKFQHGNLVNALSFFVVLLYLVWGGVNAFLSLDETPIEFTIAAAAALLVAACFVFFARRD